MKREFFVITSLTYYIIIIVFDSILNLMYFKAEMNRNLIKIANQIKYVQYVKIQRCYLSSTCNDNTTIAKTIRNAQATEIFRKNFYQMKNQESFIPLDDLDHLIVSEKIRPSLFINIFEFTGKSLGMITKYSPSIVSNIIVHAIDESATQQFNDSIRNMQSTNDNSNIEINMKCEDIKETLKFHRDLRNISQDSTNNNNPTMSNNNDNDNNQINDNIKFTFTTFFYHILKISEKY